MDELREAAESMKRSMAPIPKKPATKPMPSLIRWSKAAQPRRDNHAGDGRHQASAPAQCARSVPTSNLLHRLTFSRQRKRRCSSSSPFFASSDEA